MSETDPETDSLDYTPIRVDSVIQDDSEDEVFFGKVSEKEKYGKNSKFTVRCTHTMSDRRGSFEVGQAGYRSGSRELFSLQDSVVGFRNGSREIFSLQDSVVGFRSGSREIFSLQDSVGSRSSSLAEDHSEVDKDELNVSFESPAAAQNDDLQEGAENNVDDDHIPYLFGQNEFEGDLFFSDSEINENTLPPPNDLTQLDEFGDFNENYLVDHGNGGTVENDFVLSIPAMEPNKVYEFELEPVNSEAPVSDLNENHPTSDHNPISGTVNPQFGFEDNEFVKYQEAPITTGQNEQPQESSNCCEDQLKTTHKKSTHKCDICSFTAIKRSHLARHIKSHFMEPKFQFKCHLCDAAYSSESSLKNHSWKHTGIKLHACTLCSSRLCSAPTLRRHVKYKHTHEKDFKCAQCDYASVEKGKVNRHMACHTGERPHQCNDCSKAFPTFFNLKRHIRIHTMEKPYKCDICSASFAQLNAMQGHRKIHTDDKPLFQCVVCPSTFGRKCDLRNHYKQMHTSNTPVHCEKCVKVFKDLYSLKCHKKEHTRFSCSLCTFSCTSLNYFKRHSNTHTGVKPLKCDLCNTFFEEKGRLKNHQILAHTEFKPLKKQKCKRIGSRVKCHHCDKTFSSEGHFQRHLRMVMMPTDSDEALKRETTMKLDKVMDEMLERKTNVNIEESDQVLSLGLSIPEVHSSDISVQEVLSSDMSVQEVLNSDMSVQEVLNSDMSVQEVLNSDTDHINLVEEIKVKNGVIEFYFDSDDPSEEVSFPVEIDTEEKNKEKIKDIETCFGFNESFLTLQSTMKSCTFVDNETMK